VRASVSHLCRVLPRYVSNGIENKVTPKEIMKTFKMGWTSPLALMRTLQVGTNPSRLARALVHFDNIFS
jgi:hypothetical protein